MLSSSSKYAVNAVLYIAVHSDEEKKIRVKEVAEAIKIPSPFLAKILQTLSKEGIVSSSKGPGGGFYMTSQNLDLKVIEVVKTIDGLDRLEDCVLGLERCSSETPCPVHFAVEPLKKRFMKDLQDNSIRDYARKVKEEKAFLLV